MRRFGARLVAILCICGIPHLQCDTSSDPEPDALSLTPIPAQQATIIDSNYTYSTVSFTAVAAGPAPIVYSMTGKPANATFSTATGAFSWTPTVADFGTYSVTITAVSGTDTVADTVVVTVPAPALDSGVVFKMITPNGGEVYNYGDTITCMWLQDLTVTTNGMLKVNNGPVSCVYFDASSYLKAANDTTAAAIAAGIKYFRKAGDHTFVAVCQVVLIDRPMSFSGCGATFGGSEMSFLAYDEYKPPACSNCFDGSDSLFTVVKP